MQSKLLEPFAVEEKVWIRSSNMKKAAIGTIKAILTTDHSEVAEVTLGTDYYDWDNELKLIAMEGSTMQYDTYRLEHIRREM